MLWPIAGSLYVLAGGALAPLLLRGQPPHVIGFDPAAAFVVVTGTVLLWPVLLAVAWDRGDTR